MSYYNTGHAHSSAGKQAEPSQKAQPEAVKTLPCRYCWTFYTNDTKKLSHHMHYCFGLGGGVRASEVIKTGISSDPFEDLEVTKARMKKKKVPKNTEQPKKQPGKLRPSNSVEY